MTLDASASESSANSQHGPAAAARPSIATTMTSDSSPQANQNATPATREKPRQSLSKRYRTEIAASSSSVFSTLVAFPLDSVKTRMQTYQYRGFLDCVKQTYTKESLGGFFRDANMLTPTTIQV
ncbi:Solute carrier family 25 member 47-B [Beauveria bassiana]|uniref:Solute carrier family 25 member 47-B n=1 Tax=Beauveria bassiana TaxID=176275 RepID=A0A2N6NX32_BEABA|nr:Solute carrier family 25 member 47-B [Beauveria bassiana]KAH8709676.1 Solute carrier family 25 member 47-B [Beauveria bassiana]PMB71825.1 Solute carrier family 25 member 47-B [Beauveria bassiana]